MDSSERLTLDRLARQEAEDKIIRIRHASLILSLAIMGWVVLWTVDLTSYGLVSRTLLNMMRVSLFISFLHIVAYTLFYIIRKYPSPDDEAELRKWLNIATVLASLTVVLNIAVGLSLRGY